MAKNVRYFTIEERNDWFAKLPPAKKRVQIAKDVIEQLDLKKFVSSPGTYFNLKDVPDSYDYGNHELQKVLNDSGECKVCAKGAIFATKVLNYNNCVINTDDKFYFGTLELKESILSENLSDIFSKKQLDLIENAFECDYTNICSDEDDVHLSDLVRARFMYGYICDDPDSTERMRLIMQNIIDNNGTFVVDKLEDFDSDTQERINDKISRLR